MLNTLRPGLTVLLTDFDITDRLRDVYHHFAGPNPNVVFIASAAQPGWWEYKAREFCSMYQPKGHFDYIGHAEPSEHHLSLIHNADVLVFGSGSARGLDKDMKAKPQDGELSLEDHYLSRKDDPRPLLVMGMSAGSIYQGDCHPITCGILHLKKGQTFRGKPVRGYKIQRVYHPMSGLLEGTCFIAHGHNNPDATQKELELIQTERGDWLEAFAFHQNGAVLFQGDSFERVEGKVQYSDGNSIRWI